MTDRWIDLDDVTLWGENPNEGDVGAIATSIRQFGFHGALQLWHKEVRGGNHTVKALRHLLAEGWQPRGDGIRRLGRAVQVRYVDISELSEAEADAFGIALNRTTRLGRDDPAQVAELLLRIREKDEKLFTATGYDDEDFHAIHEDIVTKLDEDVVKTHGELDLFKYPSSNVWGIPDLPLDAQLVELPQPVEKWGTLARTSNIKGLYHFYTEDYKFTNLWERPYRLVESGCKAIVEVNPSTHIEQPPIIAFAEVFMKRYLSCFWAENGVKLLADLHVERHFSDLNWYGIPPEWRSYANRAFMHDLEHLDVMYEQACEHVGDENIYYVVFGGRDEVQALCETRGWMWTPEYNAVARGEYE